MSKRSFLLLSLSLFSLFVLFSSPALATFNLTALPTEGGFDLRFRRIAPGDFKVTQEILLTAMADIGKQYRLLHRVIKPLSTSDGTELSSGQFKVYPLVNSNSRGTLLYREETPVNEFETVFYTSNAAGENDSMRLVYTLTPQDNQVPGSYHGRIAYIMTPIDSTQEQVVVQINVYVELAGSGVPVVQVTASTGSRRLTLSSKGMGPKEDLFYREPLQVSFRIPSPVGTTYRIYQNLEGGAFFSSSGEEFDLSCVLISVSGGEKGTVAPEGDLKAAGPRVLLYASESGGAADEFLVTYQPGKDFRLQKADLYRGRLSFSIETDRAGFEPKVFETMDFEVEIVPLFDIYVYTEGREGLALKFGEVSYKSGPKTSESEVYVETNMARPYRVVQKVTSPMMNEKGDKVPAEDFVVQVKEVQSNEEPRSFVKDPAPVREGETLVFSSGPRGESARFKAEYKLTMRPDTKSGSYTTLINFSMVLD